MIHLKDFSYRYRGREDFALQSINLEIASGEFTLLTGPSGCGKSTLALAVAGVLFSQYDGEVEGTVAVAGMDVQEKSIYQIADVVGLVQQNPESQFCTLRVEDEIVFGLENRKYNREKIDSLLTWSLEMTGIKHLRGRDLGTLSGGEKQKVALASILASQPEVIVFDEPTSNLDPPSTEEIFDVILNLQRKTDLTVLVIEHKLDFLSRVKPRIIEMGMGCILEPDRKSYPAPEIQVKKPAFTGSTEHPLLEVERLSVGYQNQPVLKEVSFRLDRGEWVSLMGDNGSGKSTLLLSLLGLVKKSAGEVRVLGDNVDQVPSSTLGKNVGLVFQNPDHQLFASTVWEEAVFGARNFKLEESEFKEIAQILLERAGLGDRVKEHPYRLSYGEKRRLNLISVLTYKPDILLLDEIFIGQDLENAEFLLTLLCEFVEGGGSVIMVNHNPAYYPEVVTRIFFLLEEKLVVDAPLREGIQALAQIGKDAYLPGGGF